MRKRFNVILLHRAGAPIHEAATKILSKIANVREVQSNTQGQVDEQLIGSVQDADAILVRYSSVTKELIEAAKQLKIIAVHGAGLDYVDIEAATKKGIVVTRTPLANSTSVAEFAMTLILLLARKIPMTLRLMEVGKWAEARSIESKMELSEKTLGIIGLGNVGAKVARRAKAFEMRILAFDPYVSKEKTEEVGAQLVDLRTLLKESDVVTIHAALTQEVWHMIGEEELRMMRKGAVLINTSRGAAVNEKALYRALKDKWIAGAALDVLEKEPASLDNPLLTLDNVIITPHIAGTTEESLVRMATTAAEDIVRFLKGQTPIFPV